VIYIEQIHVYQTWGFKITRELKLNQPVFMFAEKTAADSFDN
jgi:hypothetical protein